MVTNYMANTDDMKTTNDRHAHDDSISHFITKKCLNKKNLVKAGF